MESEEDMNRKSNKQREGERERLVYSSPYSSGWRVMCMTRDMCTCREIASSVSS
jgi:hypothetical protein